MSARRWTSVLLSPTAPGIPMEDWSACCVAALADLGCLGTEERGAGADALVVAWLPEGSDAARVPELLCAAGLAAGVVGVEAVEDPGWVEQFNASLRPIDVGQRLTILPHPGDAPAGRVAIVIEPGRAFGTGHHESTRLALEHLERNVTPGATVLDVGTGSGLLALAAARLGAARAVGIDNDPEAIEVAQANVAGQPEAPRISLELASHPRDVAGAFDVVVANITSDVLLPMLPGLLDRMAPAGCLILSGLLLGDRDPMHAALIGLGLSAEWTRDGEWVSACARLA